MRGVRLTTRQLNRCTKSAGARTKRREQAQQALHYETWSSARGREGDELSQSIVLREQLRRDWHGNRLGTFSNQSLMRYQTPGTVTATVVVVIGNVVVTGNDVVGTETGMVVGVVTEVELVTLRPAWVSCWSWDLS